MFVFALRLRGLCLDGLLVNEANTCFLKYERNECINFKNLVDDDSPILSSWNNVLCAVISAKFWRTRRCSVHLV